MWRWSWVLLRKVDAWTWVLVTLTNFLLLLPPITTPTSGGGGGGVNARTRGALRDLERNDQKFERFVISIEMNYANFLQPPLSFPRWLHNTVPENFHPHYVPHTHSRPHNSHLTHPEYKNRLPPKEHEGGSPPEKESRRRDRAGRRRRNHLPLEIYPPTDKLESLTKNISTILDSLSRNYDKRVRPNYGADPVEVTKPIF